MTNRREFLICGAASLLVPKFATSAPVKSMLAERNYMITQEEEDDEAMYKELFENFMANTFPQGSTIVIPTTKIRNSVLSSLNVDTVIFSELTSVAVFSDPNFSQISVLFNSNLDAHIRVLAFPKFTYWGYYYRRLVNGIQNLEHLYIPNVTEFQNSAYGFAQYVGPHLNVHIDKTATDIMAMPNFPGFGSASLALDKVSFVGTDGVVSWDGTQWVATPNS